MTLNQIRAAKEELENAIGDAAHAAICRFNQKTGLRVSHVKLDLHDTMETIQPAYVSANVSIDLEI